MINQLLENIQQFDVEALDLLLAEIKSISINQDDLQNKVLKILQDSLDTTFGGDWIFNITKFITEFKTLVTNSQDEYVQLMESELNSMDEETREQIEKFLKSNLV